MPFFTELQTTTNFSFLRGGSHPEEFIHRASELNYSALAVTDHNTLAGVVRAYAAAKTLNFPFIVGCRITLLEKLPKNDPLETDGTVELLDKKEPSFPFSLLLYPTTRAAYGRLSTLLTQGKARAPKGRCYLLPSDVAEFNDELLAIISLHSFKHPRLKSFLALIQEGFSSNDRLSLAFSRSYAPDEHKRLEKILALAKEFSLPLVATNDALYHAPERRKLQDVLTCIRKNCTLEEAGFSLMANAERYLKPSVEIARLFAAYPKALERTQSITERALGFSLSELRYEYPHEIYVEGQSPQQTLVDLAIRGAKERYPNGVPEQVTAQLNYEFALIEELNYAKYFLTVYDIVLFAKERGILCQGRGAAANSTVCYCLGITAVDPDQINLLFERFISRERNEPPDIDIDFEHERREEVIQYIYNKYGRHRAALVAEVISYRTRSAVRDVGKVFGVPPDTLETLSKFIRHTSLDELDREALQKIGLGLHDPRVQDLLSIIRTIRSFPRHLSQHVGGFVISETPLSEIVPIENAAMADRTVIEWDKSDIDVMGMLKIDILGLGMLTCIRKGIEMINNLMNHRAHGAPRETNISHSACSECSVVQTPLFLHTIPPEDHKVYDMISAADTIGVFQIESRAQMSMLPRLRPQCFYDLVIEVAIVRPGPIVGGMVHPYLNRRMGKEPVTYPNSKVQEILKSTLGVPIFQEQVMALVIAAAGFTPGEADNLRRGMANWKRNKDLMGQFGAKITAGMLANGYTREYAQQILQQIAGFGEYGFPQSHAASFALLVYVSSWIKCHHPAVFAAALLNSQPMGFYQPSQIIQDAKQHGVEVCPVDVNASKWDCTIEVSAGRPALRLGMRLVKSLSELEADKISSAVSINGAYSSLLKLWRESGIRISSLRHLARADAFCSLSLKRQQALWEIKKFREELLPLLEQREEKEPIVSLPQVSSAIQVLNDYAVTGLSLKGHPLHFLREQLTQWGVLSIIELKNRTFRPRSLLTVAGIVLVRQRPSTANGVLFMTIEDETGMANLIIRPQIAERYRSALCESTIVAVKGRYQNQEGVVHLLVEEAASLSHHWRDFSGMSRDFH